ncbi:LysR family transcriptional regulator [Novacetimonas hansenii]|uniref:LysR family transcriptional regulator n=2 Tax=Novacetimonas hansenii TaxID=436 RepID=A0ABQ0SIB8_NOVHA|nr:LysR family transcriptional regulator [Novacetimonas hansenii]EFG84884.1 probable transcriptional regulator protein, LysR family [Novacetimonas hansenii ATCC 23769]GAN82541.1 transcriptional regulator LysR [Novacetimonas hansenii JCM 7643]GBQ60669.1 transcriptional regulator [Novacetimonas hansenii NRIC 0243]GEC65174.1 LysR family transcriptional regulator [Novacetimonas hansenii]
MDQLTAMRAFVRVVESGNFTRAAKALGMPNATMTTHIQALEAHLKTKLLNRSTRRVVVTNDGAIYYERAKLIIADIDEIDASLKNSHVLPNGRVRVEMSGGIADLVVLPALHDFYNKYPDIHIDLGVSDRPIDYIAENVDCALRSGAPTDSSLIARRVAEFEFVTCASPFYLERHGIPKHPKDLETGHQMIRYFRPQSGRALAVEFHRENKKICVDPPSVLSVNDARTFTQGIRMGLGVGCVPQLLVQSDLRQGRLVELLPEWEQPPITIYLVFPSNRHVSNRVRVFSDWLINLLSIQN